MPITIMSMDEAIKLCYKFDYIISITDPRQRLPSFGEHNHLHVSFVDTNHPSEKEYMQMQRGVRAIFSWVREKKLTGEENILVHCHAGISRSAAIAWALSVLFGEGDYMEAFCKLQRERDIIWPNTQVMLFADNILRLDMALYRVAAKVDTLINENQKRGWWGKPEGLLENV